MDASLFMLVRPLLERRPRGDGCTVVCTEWEEWGYWKCTAPHAGPLQPPPPLGPLQPLLPLPPGARFGLERFRSSGGRPPAPGPLQPAVAAAAVLSTTRFSGTAVTRLRMKPAPLPPPLAV